MGAATPAILFFKDVLQINHLALIHSNDGYGNAYARASQKAASEFAPDMKLSLIDTPFETVSEDYVKAVRILKNTQYKYFFAIVDGARDYNNLMIEAHQQEVAGTGEHNWFFSDSLAPKYNSRSGVRKGTPVALASRGVFMLSAVGGLAGEPAYETFVEKWQQLNNELDIEY
eukprot:g9478.t1 g9478   contig37:41612-42127(+)